MVLSPSGISLRSVYYLIILFILTLLSLLSFYSSKANLRALLLGEGFQTQYSEGLLARRVSQQAPSSSTGPYGPYVL